MSMLNKMLPYALCLALIFCDHQKIANGQQSTAAPRTKNLTSKDYRLDPGIDPENYKITIRLGEDFHLTKKFTVENCTIKFNIPASVKGNQSRIRIHYDLDHVNEHSVKLYDSDGYEIPVKMEAAHADTQIAVITLGDDEYLDREYEPYFLEFLNVSGTLRTDNKGFYLSQYQHGNQTKYVATTQFQTTYARSAFPCFDEPRYKATFDISIKKPKRYTTILSNTRKIKEAPVKNSNLTKVTFDTTPEMSTYLVAFLVSTFENLTDPQNANYATYFPEGQGNSAQFAVNISRRLAENIGNSTGLVYADLGISKLHQVALPDFSAGAMENWGLNTYRESSLLWDPKQSTTYNKQRVLTVVAHEISHTWFGDFVTMDWWSETWLNEGFATYFEYHAAANIEPDFDLRNQFVYQIVQYVLEQDCLATSLPLSSKPEDVYTQDHIDQKFGAITYEKGASVIRMIEHIMTTPLFFAALHNYLDKHRNNNTVASDLLSALEQEGLPHNFMTNWIYSPGYPVVTVRRIDNDAVLTQQRFLIDEANSTTKWHIPISYASRTHNANFNETRPSHWLLPTNDLVIYGAFEDSDWIAVNIQQTGFFRVDYDLSLWTSLISALKSDHFGGITPINRAQLIEDVMNMAKSGRQSYKLAMNLTKYLADDVDFYPWASASASFRFLFNQVKGDKELYQKLLIYLLELTTNVIQSAHFIPTPLDSPMAITKNVMVMNWASYLEEGSYVKQATEEFNLFKTSPESHEVNPNVKSVVYCLGVRHGTPSDWEFLYARFLKVNMSSERETILSALGCSKNETILTNYLLMSINDTSGIRRQDADSVILSAISSNATVAFSFFKKHMADIKSHYASMNAMSNILSSFAGVFGTKAEVEDFKAFIRANMHQLAEASGTVAENAIKTAETNLQWIARFGEELREWLRIETADYPLKETVENPSKESGSIAIKSSMGMLLACAVVLWFN